MNITQCLLPLQWLKEKAAISYAVSASLAPTFAGVTTALQQVSTPSLHKFGAMLVPKGEGSCGMGRLQVTHDRCANRSALVYGVCKVTVNSQPGDDCFLLITGISFFKPDEEVRKANDRASGTAFNFFGCLTSTD